MSRLETRPEPVVADVMTQVVVNVEPETPIEELVTLLADRHISGVPIVSREGEILGVVSTSDVLRLAETPDAKARTVLDIATRKVVTIDELTPLSEAARHLLELGIRRVLVTRNGRFAGILTATDVLKWVARPALEAAAARE